MNSLASVFWKAFLKDLALATAAALVTELVSIGVEKAFDKYTKPKKRRK